MAEQVEICVAAQGKFLQGHLGWWIDLFAQSLALNTNGNSYLALARFAVAFVKADAARLGVQLERQHIEEVKHTPFDPDFSCASCPAAEMIK
jgi:TorA maturation chaperone TorD